MWLKWITVAAVVAALSLNTEARAAANEPVSLKKPVIIFPVMGPRLSSKFGKRIHPLKKFSHNHKGVDLAAPAKSHVFAVTDGVVVFAGYYEGFGKLITIKHQGKAVSLYGHLSAIQVNMGDTVKAGQVIGRVGSTGHSTGPHLHFEWRVDGQPIDPLKRFPSMAGSAEG